MEGWAAKLKLSIVLDDRKTRLADLALASTAPQILPDADAQIDDKRNTTISSIKEVTPWSLRNRSNYPENLAEGL